MILDRLKKSIRIEEGPRSHLDVENSTITIAREEDLRHELLHLVLRHWKMCGRGVNLAADMALRPFLEEDENLISELPSGSTLEEHLSETSDLPPEFGRRNLYLDELICQAGMEDQRRIQAHLNDMGSAPLEVQLALVACFTCICAEDYMGGKFGPLASLPKELQAAALRGPLPAQVLKSRVVTHVPEAVQKRVRLALTGRFVEEVWAGPPDQFGLDEPFAEDGRLIGWGSGKNLSIRGRRLHSAILFDSTLTDCTGWVGELIRCNVKGSHLRCRRATNCVLRGSQIDSEESTCNLHLQKEDDDGFLCNRNGAER